MVMNKLLIVGLLLIAMIGMNIAGGLIGIGIKPVNIELEYPSIALGNELSRTEMIQFDELDYVVKGNTIILNKENDFKNKEIKVSFKQSCLNFVPSICKDINVPEPKTEYEFIECKDEILSVCLKWTNYSKIYFIEQAIQKELEFVQGVQETRLNMIVDSKTDEGKILIK